MVYYDNRGKSCSYRSLVATIEAACSKAGRRGIPVKDGNALIPSHKDLSPGDIPAVEYDEGEGVEGNAADYTAVAVPEHSHPGESASNGLAERSVQLFQDLKGSP